MNMMYFDLCKIKVNGNELIVERFGYDYGIDFIGNQKRTFNVITPLGFNKRDEVSDGYPIFHNLLLSKEQFNLVLEVEVNGEWVTFVEFDKCMVLNKSCVAEPLVSFEFSGRFEEINEHNDALLELTRIENESR